MSVHKQIYNFLEIDEQLSTAGQPTREQFKVLKQNGYRVIINLADGSTEDDLPEESEIVNELDLAYHHIPVHWEYPDKESLYRFFKVMDAQQTQKILVHCIANYRATAFVMLYRIVRQSVPIKQAIIPTHQIWQPETVAPIWQTFIQDILKENGIELS
ncbi:MAG: protein tyrosine phosphatase family protein [Anaerolineae bacterium]